MSSVTSDTSAAHAPVDRNKAEQERLKRQFRQTAPVAPDTSAAPAWVEKNKVEQEGRKLQSRQTAPVAPDTSAARAWVEKNKAEQEGRKLQSRQTAPVAPDTSAARAWVEKNTPQLVQPLGAATLTATAPKPADGSMLGALGRGTVEEFYGAHLQAGMSTSQAPLATADASKQAATLTATSPKPADGSMLGALGRGTVEEFYGAHLQAGMSTSQAPLATATASIQAATLTATTPKPAEGSTQAGMSKSRAPPMMPILEGQESVAARPSKARPHVQFTEQRGEQRSTERESVRDSSLHRLSAPQGPAHMRMSDGTKDLLLDMALVDDRESTQESAAKAFEGQKQRRRDRILAAMKRALRPAIVAFRVMKALQSEVADNPWFGLARAAPKERASEAETAERASAAGRAVPARLPQRRRTAGRALQAIVAAPVMLSRMSVERVSRMTNAGRAPVSRLPRKNRTGAPGTPTALATQAADGAEQVAVHDEANAGKARPQRVARKSRGARALQTLVTAPARVSRKSVRALSRISSVNAGVARPQRTAPRQRAAATPTNAHVAPTGTPSGASDPVAASVPTDALTGAVPTRDVPLPPAAESLPSASPALSVATPAEDNSMIHEALHRGTVAEFYAAERQSERDTKNNRLVTFKDAKDRPSVVQV